MNTSEAFDSDNDEPSKGERMPRWMGALLGAIGFPLVHGVLPWGISLLSRRHGWSGRRPGWWNLLGLIPVIGGSVCAVWGMTLHSIQRWQWTRYQTYLLRRGPYRFSRHPMYVGELALWLGWAIFYGSISVLLGWVVWWAGFVFMIVPGEERALEAQFGASFRQYKGTVPRWLGKVRR